MKKIAVLLLLLFAGFNSYSQIRSVLLNNRDEIITDSAEAKYYAVYGKVAGDSLYTFKKFDFDGTLMTSGSFRDESLKIPQGKFIFYSWITPDNNPATMEYEVRGKERFIELTGVYQDGLQTGRWVSFYADGKMKQIMTFSMGIAHGAYMFYNYDGKLMVSGLFLNGKRNGTWILNSGKQENEYVNGELISTLKGKKLREKNAQNKNMN